MGRGGAAPGGQRAEGAGNLRFLSAAEPSVRALCASSVYVRDLRRNLGKRQNACTASGLICFAAIAMHEAVRPPAKRRSRFHAPGGESFSRPPKRKSTEGLSNPGQRQWLLSWPEGGGRGWGGCGARG